MKPRRLQVVTVAAVLLVTALAMSVAPGIGAGQNGYLSDITVGPGSRACIGGAITLSGSGAPAGSPVTVGMNYKVPGGYPSAHLGDTDADGAGNWSLTAMVPYTSMTGEPAPTPTPVGDWEVAAIATGYTAVGDLTVVSCEVALPATGFSVTAAALLGSGCLAAAGLGALSLRRRS